MPAETGIASRSFHGTSGGAEHFIAIEAPEALPFGEQVRMVEALSRAGSATLADMMHLIVYLRDPTDFASVESYLGETLPGLPSLIVHAPVCRPEWLVEVEEIAVSDSADQILPSF